jgi:ATP-dependent DNA helicase RecG
MHYFGNDNSEFIVRHYDRDSYTDEISLEQNLTFTKTTDSFLAKSVVFGHNEMLTLGIQLHDGSYTNLGLLLSEQCLHSIKVAIFEGNDKEIFRDTAEFGGSVFQQLEDTYRYLNFYNKTHATIKGLERYERRDYPETAMREALLNAIIHRDYSFSGSILVSLYDDRLEIVSLGGTVENLPLETIYSGISQSRNEKLANVFYRLRYVEAYGTGIPRILSSYKDYPFKPVLKITQASFSITLPNINAQLTQTPILVRDNSSIDISFTEQEEKIIALMKDKGRITRKDAMQILNVGQTRSFIILTKLAKLGIIRIDSSKKETLYELKTDN